ncbi:MAG: hypothetical protein RLZZ126_304 [Pseudomonadota bacterium]|jgi:hypothetical protein
MAFDLLSLLRRPHYQSEATDLIQQLKTARPTLEDRQRAGRALLWDKDIDRDAQAAQQQARVPQAAYVYQTKISRQSIS